VPADGVQNGHPVRRRHRGRRLEGRQDVRASSDQSQADIPKSRHRPPRVQALARGDHARCRGLRALNGTQATKPTKVAQVEADIVARWKSDASIPAEFNHFGAYAEFRNAAFCRENQIRRDEFDAGHGDADTYIAGLERQGAVSEADKAAVRQYAAQWLASEDLRSGNRKLLGL